MTKNILTTFTSRIITAITSFVLLLFTTNDLGAEGRGIISLLTASCGLISLFSGFIGSSAMVYLIPRNKNKDFILQVFVISYIWTIVVGGVLVAIFLLAKSVSKEILVHIFFIGV